MEVDKYYQWGDVIEVDQLARSDLKDIASCLSNYPFARLLGANRRDDLEALIVDFSVERPQFPPVPIQSHERIAIGVEPESGDFTACALRKDFPDIPHLYLAVEGEPRRLCLFEEQQRNLKHVLTPVRVLKRISDWLARAATDTLHLVDQPVEPLTFGAGSLIADPHLFTEITDKPDSVIVIKRSERPLVLEAMTVPEGEKPSAQYQIASFLVFPITTPPHYGQVIQHMPANLLQLCQLLAPLHLSLENKITTDIQHLYARQQFDKYCRYKVIIFLTVPRQRTEDGPVETLEHWAFILETTLEDLSIKLGLMGRVPDQPKLGRLLAPYTVRDMDTVVLWPLHHISPMSRLLAQTMAGLPESRFHFAVIGLGALGSPVVHTLAQQGFGIWSFIDPDTLWPHNLERHVLPPIYVGTNKAVGMAHAISELLNEEKAATAFAIDYLDHSKVTDELRSALQSSDCILDFSASHAVTRELAHADYGAMRQCAFLGPDGHSLFILSEGRDRPIRLDDLDLQRAACIYEKEELRDIYQVQREQVHYARSCRDVSVQLSQSLVTLFSGITARFIQNNWQDPQPAIHLWRWSDNSLTVGHYVWRPQPLIFIERNGWSLRVVDNVARTMRACRQQQIPNETGGVLLGQVDYQRRIIYVVMALDSPSDSIEQPDLYIRGAKELGRRIDEVKTASGGDLSYVGEWHSHPAHCGNTPSATDLAALEMLRREMLTEGLPAMIAIQGEDPIPNFVVA